MYQAGSCRVSQDFCIVFSELVWEGLFRCTDPNGIQESVLCCNCLGSILNTRKQESCQGSHNESVQVQFSQS